MTTLFPERRQAMIARMAAYVLRTHHRMKFTRDPETYRLLGQAHVSGGALGEQAGDDS
jgi:hypothetical protein